MDYNEFAETIKAKHPEYKDKDNLTLAKTVVEKYPQYAEKVTFEPSQPQDTSMLEVAKMGVQAALPSPEATSPIAPTSGNPAIAGLQAAGQTLRDPSRIQPTLALPGQLAGEKVSKEIGGVTGKIAGFGTAMALDPSTYVGGAPIEAATIKSGFKGVKNFVTSLFSKSATPEELNVLVTNFGKKLSVARQQVGAKLGELKGTQEEALDRLGKIAEKGVAEEMKPQEAAQMYSKYFENRPEAMFKNAPRMEEDIAGATLKDVGAKATPLKSPMAAELKVVDPVTVPKDKPYALYIGSSKPYGKAPGLDYYDIHGAGGPISESNRMPTMSVSGVEDLQKFKDQGIEILGKKARAGEQIPQHVMKAEEAKPLTGYEFKTPKEEIKYLLKIKEGFKEQMSKKTLDQQGNLVKSISSQDERAFSAGMRRIDERISKLPGGQEIIAQNKKFSQLADIYDDLGEKLKNPNEAREFLRKMFIEPKGKMLDLKNKLKVLEKEIGGNILNDLEKAFESTKGLTYEQFKHPFASIARAALPQVGPVLKRTTEAMAAPIMSGLQKLNDNPTLQDLKARLAK